MLLLCIRSYLKAILKYKYQLLDTDHPDTLYLREQGCEDPLLFFEAKRGPQANNFGKHCYRPIAISENKMQMTVKLADVKLKMPIR
jgi:hypothetical protein